MSSTETKVCPLRGYRRKCTARYDTTVPPSIVQRFRLEFFPASPGISISHSPREISFFSRHMIPTVEPLHRSTQKRRSSGHHDFSVPARLGRIRRPPSPPPIVRSRRPSCYRSLLTHTTTPYLGAAFPPPPQPPRDVNSVTPSSTMVINRRRRLFVFF